MSEQLNRREFLQISAATLLATHGFATEGSRGTMNEKASRREGGWYTRERMEAARRNVARHAWAAELRDRTVAACEPWLRLAPDELWKMIPGQTLPRTIDVVMTRELQTGQSRRKGCPTCGADAGYRVEFWQSGAGFQPAQDADRMSGLLRFQVACLKCGEWFPKNDFAAYYESGRDESGLFDPQRADRRLLFNREHPAPQDPLRTFGVDDGWGYRDAEGFTYRFIALYADHLWGQLLSAVTALGDAFVYTGERDYARRCAILLDRIADVYPDMDWSPFAQRGWYHSDGDSGKGKIFGRISECGVLTTLAQGYDKIGWAVKGDGELWAFLNERGRRHRLPSPKGKWEDFCRGVEERVLLCGLQAVKDENIRGNRGHHETAAAWAAIALNREAETREWLDWIFSPQGLHVPKVLTEQLDRDGMGAEGAPGYGWGWGIAFNRLAELLEGYGKYDRWRFYRDFPLFRNVFTAPFRMAVLNRFIPTIGDFGSCMGLHSVSQDTAFLLDGFRRTADPKIAQAIITLNGGSAQDVRGDVFDKQPERWRQKVEQAAANSPPLPSRGRHLPGFGMVALEHGVAPNGYGLWLYYGRNYGHGHQDCLNVGLLAHGVDLLPDLGYPDFATRFYEKRRAWTFNTLSHNTVVVDKSPQQPRWSGKTRFVKFLPGVRVAEISSRAYPQTQDYRRLIALIETPDGVAYAWDVFRVAGGRDHLLSYHGPEGEVAVEGLSPIAQKRGTYAGEEIPFAARIEGEGIGFSYLTNVRRCQNPPPVWSVTWQVAPRWLPKDARPPVALRLHHLTSDVHDVALCDNPKPAQRSAVENLTYLLAHRASSSSLASTFVTVLEPFAGESCIARVRRVPTDVAVAVAVEVTLRDGAVDTLLSAPQPGTAFRTESGWLCDAAFAHVRTREGQVEAVTMVQGSLIELPSVRLKMQPAFIGTVSDFDRLSTQHTTFTTDAALPTDGRLNGETVIFETDADTDAAYRICEVSRKRGRTRVCVGLDSFALGYRNPDDYAQGFRYVIAPGARFTIPNHAQGR